MGRFTSHEEVVCVGVCECVCVLFDWTLLIKLCHFLTHTHSLIIETGGGEIHICPDKRGKTRITTQTYRQIMQKGIGKRRANQPNPPPRGNEEIQGFFFTSYMHHFLALILSLFLSKPCLLCAPPFITFLSSTLISLLSILHNMWE